MNAPLRTATLSCLVLQVQLAIGQTSVAQPSFEKSLTTTELERVYLACDLAATTTRLSPADAMRCSIVSEEFKHRVFDGDLERLLVWWRAQRRAPDGYVATSEAAE